MIAKKRAGSLGDLVLRKDEAAQPERVQDDQLPASQRRRKGQTIRLDIGAWKQLKIMAVEHETTCHDLLLEALNDLFRKYGKPPVA